MNITGKYMKVWEVKESNGYTKLDLGDGRKDKNGETEYCTWFDCLLLGNASKKSISKGDVIEITSGQIFQRKYNDKWYIDIKIWHLTVSGQESKQEPAKDENGFTPPPPMGTTPFDDSDIPF
jgi:hypothetical protein